MSDNMATIFLKVTKLWWIHSIPDKVVRTFQWGKPSTSRLAKQTFSWDRLEKTKNFTKVWRSKGELSGIFLNIVGSILVQEVSAPFQFNTKSKTFTRFGIHKLLRRIDLSKHGLLWGLCLTTKPLTLITNCRPSFVRRTGSRLKNNLYITKESEKILTFLLVCVVLRGKNGTRYWKSIVPSPLAGNWLWIETGVLQRGFDVDIFWQPIRGSRLTILRR